MALVNLQGVNPYAVDRSRNISAAQSAADAIGAGIQTATSAFVTAKEKAEEKAMEEKEKMKEFNKDLDVKETETFGSLDQTVDNLNFLEDAFNYSGLKTKSEFRKIHEALEGQDLSSEERSKLNTRLSKLTGRAETINTALTNLGSTTQAIRDDYQAGNVSPGTDPKILEFTQEMLDPEKSQNYGLETDENGNEFITGKTSSGKEIRLSLDQLASGENQLRILPQVDKSDVIKGISDTIFENPAYKAGENKLGAIQYIDAEKMGEAAAPLIEKTLRDETSFRQLASEYGFGFDKFEAIRNGEPIEGDPAGEQGPNTEVDVSDGIGSEEELRGYLANLMVGEVGSDPRMEQYKQLNTSRYIDNLNQAKADEAAAEAAALAKQKQIAEDNKVISRVSSIKSATDDDNFDYLKQFEATKTKNGDSILQIKKNKKNPNIVELIYEGHTKSKPKFDTFDITKDEDAAALESILPAAPSTEYSNAIYRTAEQYLIQ